MEIYLTRIIENNYCGCYNDICRKGLTEKILQILREKKDYESEDIISLISICKGGPISEKTISIIFIMLQHLSLQGIKYECFDSLVDLFMILFIKSDPLTQECFIQDIIQYFEEVCNIECDWGKKKQKFEITFFFQKLIVKKEYNKSQSDESKISQLSVGTFQEFSQREELPISSSIKKTIGEDCSKWDTRVIIIKSIDRFVKYSSLLGKLMLKMLHTNSCNKDVKKTTKFLLQRLLFLIEISPEDLYYFPISALSSFYLDDKSELELSYSLKAPREIYKFQKSFGKKPMLTFEIGYSNNLLIDKDYEFILNNTIEAINKIQKDSNDMKAVIKSILILQKCYSHLIKEDKNKCLKVFIQLIEKLFVNFSSIKDNQK